MKGEQQLQQIYTISHDPRGQIHLLSLSSCIFIFEFAFVNLFELQMDIHSVNLLQPPNYVSIWLAYTDDAKKKECPTPRPTSCCASLS